MEMKFTSENFDTEALKSDKPVLVDFFADWCGPCKMMAPVVEALASEYEGKAVVGKLNVDDAQVLAQKYEVETIPTLILFRGGQASEQLINPASKAAILEWLKGQGAIED